MQNKTFTLTFNIQPFSRSRSLYVVVRPSVCLSSAVCLSDGHRNRPSEWKLQRLDRRALVASRLEPKAEKLNRIVNRQYH